ncbi:hypothetical protein P153DRAFT_230514 [Dothidotthia symphoricarpi CBS 119687]|uniref:Uncharacterized protein n=1 Tax=Dothidotthia symphoricarpi CBS 119687 TaxID=1392245 RepID=A0A6A6AFK6_9PLEO|nr:uncharacterized protein P153DRAFT_230514 [Dothidotthia symphoricarpi CBS 119687]KAF2130083.1 hypothetical protein P153DRAFT_230514 [Dothidotthia symphoricarpi CBS 119687]
MGEILQDTEFQVAVRSEIVEANVSDGGGIVPNTIAFAYDKTSNPCTLRKFLVDLYALTVDAQWLKCGTVPHLFLVDMAQSFLEKSRELRAGEDVWMVLTAAGCLELDGESSGDSWEAEH